LKVNAVIYFRVLHPEKAVISVENYLFGTSQMAQTTLRSTCGQGDLDELLAERETINRKLAEIIDQQTEPWGVKVRAVELKQIDLPEEMRRAMAKQAEAEREKRSKMIHAEGEFQAAQRLQDASHILSQEPVRGRPQSFERCRREAASLCCCPVVPHGGRPGELPP
jgi:regulator of protease activity HflC (stomatin/prohibitin superfamily)